VQVVQAAPAPIFTPVIKNIRKKLPANLAFRLPSNIPKKITQAGKVKLDLKIEKDNAYLRLKYVGCEKDFPGGRGYSLYCVPLQFTSATIGSKFYQDLKFYITSSTKFPLARGITAYHFQGDGFHVISWVQNQTFFQTSSGQISLNELKSIARSMANESPIRRS
jgi:hypothetical protein